MHENAVQTTFVNLYKKVGKRIGGVNVIFYLWGGKIKTNNEADFKHCKTYSKHTVEIAVMRKCAKTKFTDN